MKTAEQGKDYQFTTGEKDIFTVENIIKGAVRIRFKDESTQVLNLETVNRQLDNGEIELYYEIVEADAENLEAGKNEEDEAKEEQKEEPEVTDTPDPLPTNGTSAGEGERPYMALPYERLVENLETYRKSLANEITEEGKESIQKRMLLLEDEIALRPNR